MTDQTCKAARVKTLRGCFGERCGKPATARDYLGRPVCAECLAWIEGARSDASSLGNVLADILQRRLAERADAAVRRQATEQAAAKQAAKGDDEWQPH